MKRMAFGLGLLGMIFVLGSFFWGMDIGDRVFSAQDAWDEGFAQLVAISGAILVLLAIFLFRGALWPRWPIILWCPLSIGANIGWAVFRGYMSFSVSEFLVQGVPVMAFWVWGISHAFSKEEQ